MLHETVEEPSKQEAMRRDQQFVHLHVGNLEVLSQRGCLPLDESFTAHQAQLLRECLHESQRPLKQDLDEKKSHFKSALQPLQ